MDAHALDVMFLHQRQLPGVQSNYLTSWGTVQLHGLYMVENRLQNQAHVSGNVPILLMPGAFDPCRGEYGDQLILALLNEPGVGSICELHFRHQGVCGFIDMPSVVQDLQNIALFSTNKPILIGLSAGATALAAGLHAAARDKADLNITSALLIGPHLTNHESIFVWAINRLFKTDARLAKVARHAGHPYMARNWPHYNEWYLQSELAKAIDGNATDAAVSAYSSIPIETLYFRFETITRDGRNRIDRLLNARRVKPYLPGIHRGLFRVPQAGPAIIKFCQRHLQASSEPILPLAA
jgi:hypothetical protein